jgi:deoxycytidine triphosphate deaminase
MEVLSDGEIKRLIAAGKGVSKLPYRWQDLLHRDPGLKDPAWDGADSPIQACSFDIHIGKVFVPCQPDGAAGSADNGKFTHELEPGHSILVMSHECLAMPADIGAIALPPSSLSAAGIIVVNIGHIDPGYTGHLRFTLINMGKEARVVHCDDMVVTLLLFRVRKPDADAATRAGGLVVSDVPDPRQIDCLAKDFANFEERAHRIAKRSIDRFKRKYTISSAIAGTVLTFAVFYATTWLTMFADIKKISVLEDRANQQQQMSVDLRSLGDRSIQMAAQVAALEQANRRLEERLAEADKRREGAAPAR